MTDETAQAILALPDDGKFVHREIIWQGDWTNTDIATYAELKRMAKLWLMRDKIISGINCGYGFASQESFDDEAENLKALVEDIEAL